MRMMRPPPRLPPGRSRWRVVKYGKGQRLEEEVE